ncbi:MAG: CxxC motif-containing protein (DUF1111 family) [Paracoccaceae bacterium]
MRSTFKAVNFIALVGLCALGACQANEPPLVSATTLSNGGPVRLSPQLTPEQRLAHSRGASFFHKPWVTAPSTTSDRDGLGPLFNAHSCVSCHKGFGRGDLPALSTRESSGLLFRLYNSDTFGAQLQTRATVGLAAEAQVDILRNKVALQREFADGTLVQLIAPAYTLTTTVKNLSLSPRLAPPLFGVGLLNAIPDETLRDFADPDDNNGDGISGQYSDVGGRPGRFGWKAEQNSLRSQVAKAFHEDIGISSSVFPVDNSLPCGSEPCTILALRSAKTGTTDISDEGLAAVVDYLSVLTLPLRPQDNDRRENIKQGWRLFKQAACISCHRVGVKTAKSSNPLLSEQVIHPFSDLLLHDMGEALADRSSHKRAKEWRTAPLWGLGTAAGPYLHDGRATTLLEAILWHDGEAAASINRVLRFNSKERAALLEFLAAL